MDTDIAYYYADWIWPPQASDLMKSMLLFCDKIALSLNPDQVDEVVERDPVLAVPLSERGLLVNLDPKVELSRASSVRLAGALTELIERFPWWTRTPVKARLIAEHWGAAAAPEAAARFQQALADRGLLDPRSTEGLVNMDPRVRALVLVAFAETLRHDLAAHVALHPVAPEPTHTGWRYTYHGSHTGLNMAVVSYLAELGYDTHDYSFYGRRDYTAIDSLAESVVLIDDLTAVDVDLSAVPLDEIMDFRQENREAYREYIKGVREYLRELLALPPGDRRLAHRLMREQELRDQANRLNRTVRRAFGVRTAGLVLSLAGAAWTLRTGDPIGALLAASSAAAQAVPIPGQPISTFSYILNASHR